MSQPSKRIYNAAVEAVSDHGARIRSICHSDGKIRFTRLGTVFVASIWRGISAEVIRENVDHAVRFNITEEGKQNASASA